MVAKSISAVLLTAMFTIVSLGAFMSLPQGTSAYSPHPPIFIDGPSNFTAANGVTRGSGTPSNPYVVEGWEINASAALGIHVKNTIQARTLYFTIRNVYVHSGGQNKGIYLDGTENGRIEGVLTSDNRVGIALISSSNVVISGNQAQDGIEILDSSYIVVSTNSIGRNGIRLDKFNYGDHHIIVSGNTLRGDGLGLPWGIGVGETQQLIAAGNGISGFGWGFYLGFSAINVTISGNNISNNGVGVEVFSSFRTRLYHNNYIGNGVNARTAVYSSNGSWDDGYPSGGNYWSNYTGPDMCSGPQQNICTGPDGIGDKPVILSATNVDHYPLMRPATVAPLVDTTPPIWPQASWVTVSGVTEKGLTLTWTPASDDVWVSRYRIYAGATLIATVPASQTCSGSTTLCEATKVILSDIFVGVRPGTSVMFKVEAGDWADHWTTDGPSMTGTKPGTLLPWWVDYWYFIAAGAGAAVAALLWIRVRRRGKQTKLDQFWR